MSTEEKRVSVKAISMGYYEHLRRREGVIFMMGTDMKVPVDPKQPDGPKRWPLWVIEVDKDGNPVEIEDTEKDVTPKEDGPREPVAMSDSAPKPTRPGRGPVKSGKRS